MWAACQDARRKNFYFYYAVEGGGLCKSVLNVLKFLVYQRKFYGQ